LLLLLLLLFRHVRRLKVCSLLLAEPIILQAIERMPTILLGLQVVAAVVMAVIVELLAIIMSTVTYNDLTVR